MIAEYKTDSPDAVAAIADKSEPRNVLIHGSITKIMKGKDYVPDPTPIETAPT